MNSEVLDRPEINEKLIGDKKTSRFFSKKLYFLIGIVGILAVVIAILFLRGDNISYKTTEIMRGNIQQTVEASGDLQSLEDVDLSFQTNGVVSAIYSNVGDNVRQGEVILSLVSDEAMADLMQAQAQVNKAQSALDILYAGATDEDIEIARVTLESAQTDLENSKITGDNTVESALLSYETAQDNYNNVIIKDADTLQQNHDDLVNNLRSDVIEIRSAISDADEILGVEDTLSNSDFKIYLGANNPQTVIDAINSFDDTANARDEAEEYVYEMVDDISEDELLEIAGIVNNALDKTALTLYYTRTVLDATNIDTTNLTHAEILVYKSTIDSARATVQTKSDALLTQLQLLNATELDVATSEISSLNALNSAKLSYNNSILSNNANIALKTSVIESAQANYDKVIADVRDIDSAVYYADLNIALAQLNAASARFDKTEVKAPIDGVVTDVALDVGELATAGMNIITVQTLDSAYMISLAVPESDIVKVAEGDLVNVTFDAYGDDLNVEAYVGAIDPAETNIEGVVYYNVDIYISDIRSIALKPGMSADVTIKTENKDDTLYVVQRAILSDDDGKYVRVLDGDSYIKKPIVIGLRGDGGLVEIVSGVNEGDVVILSIEE